MLKSLYVFATTAALALSASSGHAMSINIGARVKPALDATGKVQGGAQGGTKAHDGGGKAEGGARDGKGGGGEKQ